MKKITSKHVFTAVLMIAIVLVVGVYYGIYKKNVEEVDKLKAENAKLTKTVADLKVHYDNMDTYLAEMEPKKGEILYALGLYVSDTREEDLIMQAVQTQLRAPVTIANVGLGAKSVIKSIGNDVVLNAGMPELQSGIAFVEHKSVYSISTNYEGLKGAIEALQDNKYNIAIKTLAFSNGGADNLGGSMELSFYSVRGNGKPYELPQMMEYEAGTENIFVK